MEHGLSLHIRLDNGRQILFDMGQRRLFADNAERLGINLADVDLAIVSHGHYDHGGGLRTFLGLNSKAKVYVSRDAFKPHYSLREDGLKYIGLDPELEIHDRLIFCGDEACMDKDIVLFSGISGDCLKPPGNRLLFGPAKDRNDEFRHEQSLVVREGKNVVLFAGCAHNGIVNIMRSAERHASDRLSLHPCLCRYASGEKRSGGKRRSDVYPCLGWQIVRVSRLPLFHHALHGNGTIRDVEKGNGGRHQLYGMRRFRGNQCQGIISCPFFCKYPSHMITRLRIFRTFITFAEIYPKSLKT